jgi:hypothetical protein
MSDEMSEEMSQAMREAIFDENKYNVLIEAIKARSVVQNDAKKLILDLPNMIWQARIRSCQIMQARLRCARERVECLKAADVAAINLM